MACIGAVDAVFGKLLLVQTLKAANQDTFIEFLAKLKTEMEHRLHGTGRRWYVFLDNCRIHKGRRTQAWVTEQKIRLVFNQAYHPEYNGIEGFWSQMKRLYR